MYIALLFCTLLSIGMLMPISSFGVTLNISGFLTYKSPLHNFSVQYPANWTKIDNNSSHEIVTFRQPRDNPLSEISLTITKLRNTSLEKIVENQIESNQKLLHNFSLIQYNYTSIKSKLLSVTVIFTYSPFYERYENKVKQVWFLDKCNIYTVTYKTNPENFERDHHVFEDMVNSFESIS